MMCAQENELITRTGPGTPCGALMQRYRQPAALKEELSGRHFVGAVSSRKMLPEGERASALNMYTQATIDQGAFFGFRDCQG